MVELSTSRPPYVIPSYSLTGDLLAYLKCGLQYRYQNRGALPPSRPVQLWFGEFIHAVMEEAFLRWSQDLAPATFPWTWVEHSRPIELEVNRRLRASGLFSTGDQFCPYDEAEARCRCTDPPRQKHRLLASQRAEATINTWGSHLFQLISEAEVLLQGIRAMPLAEAAQRRAEYYEVSGIVDVIGSVQVLDAPAGNLLLEYLGRQPGIQGLLEGAAGRNYEIILDYKGMRRPPNASPLWQHLAWQVQTYTWLRSQQADAPPVAAGVILFSNELVPSGQDMAELKEDVREGATDIIPVGEDLRRIRGWRRGLPVPDLSDTLREKRSIRIVSAAQESVNSSLDAFDAVVRDLELSVLEEMRGQGVVGAWRARPSGERYVAPERRTCTACDFKHHCPLAPEVGEGGSPTAP